MRGAPASGGRRQRKAGRHPNSLKAGGLGPPPVHRCTSLISLRTRGEISETGADRLERLVHEPVGRLEREQPCRLGEQHGVVGVPASTISASAQACFGGMDRKRLEELHGDDLRREAQRRGVLQASRPEEHVQRERSGRRGVCPTKRGSDRGQASFPRARSDRETHSSARSRSALPAADSPAAGPWAGLPASRGSSRPRADRLGERAAQRQHSRRARPLCDRRQLGARTWPAERLGRVSGCGRRRRRWRNRRCPRARREPGPARNDGRRLRGRG